MGPDTTAAMQRHPDQSVVPIPWGVRRVAALHFPFSLNPSTPSPVCRALLPLSFFPDQVRGALSFLPACSFSIVCAFWTRLPLSPTHPASSATTPLSNTAAIARTTGTACLHPVSTNTNSDQHFGHTLCDIRFLFGNWPWFNFGSDVLYTLTASTARGPQTVDGRHRHRQRRAPAHRRPRPSGLLSTHAEKDHAVFHHTIPASSPNKPRTQVGIAV